MTVEICTLWFGVRKVAATVGADFSTGALHLSLKSSISFKTFDIQIALLISAELAKSLASLLAFCQKREGNE